MTIAEMRAEALKATVAYLPHSSWDSKIFRDTYELFYEVILTGKWPEL